MIKSRSYQLIILVVMLPMLWLHNSGCAKEYSFEGADTAKVIPDTIPSPGPVATEFPYCILCDSNSAPMLGHWSFKNGNAFMCGGTTNSGFIGGYSRKDFTLFGPSACSIDTGLVISAFLDVPLDRDRFNITTEQAAFYYYDHNAPKDIFISMPTSSFIVTIQRYIYATGECTGTFSGTVYKANGDTAVIRDGRYKVLVK